MQLIALLCIGFSLFAAALLVLGNIFQQLDAQSCAAKLAGFFLIICLAAIQWLNLQSILQHSQHQFSTLYIALLYAVAPGFFIYCQQILTARSCVSRWQLLHTLPLLLGLLLPYTWSVPLAFFIGSCYLLALLQTVYALREQRTRFKFELLALAAFFTIGIAASVLGFIWPLIKQAIFIEYYSILIGLAFFTTLLTLLHFPSITLDVADAVQAVYAQSTLNNVNRKQIKEKLVFLMQQEKLYCHEDLSLSLVAEQLQLTSHQLSELINTEFRQSFSRFVRQYRIEEAKKLLCSEPDASILSIALSVGFSTQSNFYTAFHDLVGMTPGQYRKQ